MVKRSHREEAIVIGADSWELISFMQLPNNASVKRQVEALKQDQQWQSDHQQEISDMIDVLIKSIEGW